VTRIRHFIFISTYAGAIFLAAGIGAAATAGCHSQKPATTTTLTPEQQVDELRKGAQWSDHPTGVKQEPVAVTQGPTPLLYLFDIGGPIRIIDLTTKAQLCAADVPDRTLVRVDDRNGVTVGQNNVFPGPLKAGHTYGIYLDPSTPNVMRQGIGLPGDVPR